MFEHRFALELLGGDGDDAGAFGGVRHFHHTALHILGDDSLEHRFDLNQRYHLPADFHKPLDPADVPEIAILIEVAHISGVIPALANVQGGLFKIVVVAQHDVVAFDQDAAIFSRAALLAGFVVLDADLYAGNGLTNAARAIAARNIGGYDR